ncbi:MAG: phosphoribosyltransferase family protein [Lautropia sp.]|nr:phosphoribosyltransferase family protein [Lautropia sp.]
MLNEACNEATGKPPPAPCSCPFQQRFAPHLDRIICLADYAPPLDQALGSLKFGQQAALGISLGELLMQKLARMPDSPLGSLDALIPVPLSGTRLAERGFNQSHQIARGMRTLPGHRLPAIQTGWLRRLRETRPQSSLTAHERERNLTGAFGASPRAAGKRIALIDDVMTTGSTLLAAAAALKTAGATKVVALVIARTPEHDHQAVATRS